MKIKARSSKAIRACGALAMLALWSTVCAQGSPDNIPPTATAASSDTNAVHEELRRLRDETMAAWQRRDIDGVLAHVDPDIVVTWQNGEVNRGPDAIRRFYKEMFEDKDSVLSNMVSTLTVDDLSILHGPDTAIAFGSIRDDFTFKRGLTSATAIGAGTTFALTSRWTATLVRKAGAWKLASYHVSANVFSNPVQDMVIKASGRIAATVGFVAGASIASLIAWWLRRRTIRPAA